MNSEVDFLPADYVCLHVRRMQARWRRGSLLLLTALVACGILHETQCRMQQEQVRMAVEMRLQRMANHLPDAARLWQALEAAEAEASSLAELQLAIRPSRVLAEVSAALPAGARLTHLNIATRSPAERDAEDDRLPASLLPHAVSAGSGRIVVHPVEASLEGLARSETHVARFLQALEQSGRFDQVLLQKIERHPDRPEERTFQISVTVRTPSRHSQSSISNVKIHDASGRLDELLNDSDAERGVNALPLPDRLRVTVTGGVP